MKKQELRSIGTNLEVASNMMELVANAISGDERAKAFLEDVHNMTPEQALRNLAKVVMEAGEKLNS